MTFSKVVFQIDLFIYHFDEHLVENFVFTALFVRCTNGQAKAQWSVHAMIWYWSMHDSRAKQRGVSDIDWILPDPGEPHSGAGRRGEHKGSAPILWRRLLSALRGQSRDDISPHVMSESGRHSSACDVKTLPSLQQRPDTLAPLVLSAPDSHCDPSHMRNLWMTSFLFLTIALQCKKMARSLYWLTHYTSIL